jgi:hypothetical protein
MAEVAKVTFNELYYWWIDPFTWMKSTEKSFLYISFLIVSPTLSHMSKPNETFLLS